MTPSLQQQAVVNWVRDGKGSAFVEAVAGAGKTTTLINALAETKGSVAFCAYNKKISDEIKIKIAKLNLGNRIRVGTFHSFGLNAWRRVYPQVQVDDRKKTDMTIAKYRLINSPEKLDNFTLKLVDLAKQKALGLFGNIEDRSEWYKIVEHFDLSYELEAEDDGEVTVEKGIELAIRTLKFHRELAPKIIDFSDMIYAPVAFNIRMWQNEWVFTDEAQDTNAARRALARKMLAPRGGRSVWVGDRWQACYGFTGADNDAVDQIIRDFNCVSLPLTVTYRCPKTIVRVAQQIVPHIEYSEVSPEGEVLNVEYKEFIRTDNIKTLRPEHAILCRKTKPLVALAYHLIRNGVACHVEGREIGAGLLKLINRWKVNNLEQLRDRLNNYGEKETTKLIAKGRETQAEALMDRIETILVIMDSQPPAITVNDLRQKISSMFVDGEQERKPTTTLSTVHRSKGREWENVFILGYSDYMPSPFARQEWQKIQEECLKYIAITRSQNKLTFIHGVEE